MSISLDADLKICRKLEVVILLNTRRNFVGAWSFSQILVEYIIFIFLGGAWSFLKSSWNMVIFIFFRWSMDASQIFLWSVVTAPQECFELQDVSYISNCFLWRYNCSKGKDCHYSRHHTHRVLCTAIS